MAKQKKNRKHHSETSSAAVTPAGEVKKQYKRFNWKRALLLALSTVAAFAVYEALIAMPSLRINGIPVIMPIYVAITTVLACAVIFFNNGFSTKPMTVENLRENTDISEDELEKACEKIKSRKKLAKKLMMILIPFLFALFFDMLYLFYGDILGNALKHLAGGSN